MPVPVTDFHVIGEALNPTETGVAKSEGYGVRVIQVPCPTPIAAHTMMEREDLVVGSIERNQPS